MKRKLLFLFLLTAACTQLWAQRTVSGKVTSAEDGSSLPGVNVVVVGSQQGSITDIDGNYSLQVPEGASLNFSYIGYIDFTVAVGAQSVIDVVMETDVTQLTEIVVTALGVEREVQALNYSVSNVEGKGLTEAREINLGNSLSGRVAGVNVASPSTGPAGATRILIRGNKSLNSQNQPLIVVDGLPVDNSLGGQAGLWGGRDNGDGLSSISPDDIETISVLKGANASALYGSRGGNGVINIVTKKGTKRKGVGIDFSTNYTFDKLYDQTDLQTEYGSGHYDTSTGESVKPTTLQQAFGDGRSSWGPALDGSSVLQWDGVSRPYSYVGNNFEKFYRTGSTWTNSVSLSGGGDNQTYRFSVTDLRNESIVPNSGFDRTNVTLSTNGTYFKKLTLNAKLMYSNEYAKNRPNVSDSPSNATQSVWYVPNNVDVRNYYGPEEKPGSIPEGLDPTLYTSVYNQGGDPRGPGMEWLPAANNWGQNPYWATYTEIHDDTRERLIGSAQLKYDITDWLWASGRIGMDWFNRRDTNLTPQGTGYNIPGSRSEGIDNVKELNMEWMLGGDHTFGKVGLTVFVGGNKMHREYERIAANGNGFNVDFFPAINNAKSRDFGYGFTESGINSLFGSAEISYGGWLYITATGRNDWFSVLNPEFNSIFYPSIGASWVVSDMLKSMPSAISFAKLRASWAQVGIANVGAYETNLTYGLNTTHLNRPTAGISGAFGYGGSLANPLLQPALSTELEIGFDVRLFQDRLGIDFAWYSQETTDDIVDQTISRATGFSSTKINIGKITNKGYEVQLRGTPVEGALSWDISVNFAYNKNEIVSLLPGLTEIVGEEPRTRNAFIKHIVGEPFGAITGREQATDPNGNLVFDSQGRAVADPDFVVIGYGVAPWSGGINNAFNFKNFNMEFLIDFRAGGDIFSGTNLRMTQNGSTKQSVQGREGEEPLHITGVTNTGTSEAPVWTPVDRDLTPLEAQRYWGQLGDQSNGVSSAWMYSGDFWKLRQVVFGYTFPRKMLGNSPFQRINLAFVARNLWVISKQIDNVDPESAYSAAANAQGLEYFALPATRSYGFNLSIGF
jgi:TonB-linked SusC/RagA family outer membrane protein